ncbi:HdeD family acid-resistance protein [Lacticaseibacillus absianus]|uniref:HdeD family acid-resistance protein n=1 Tax=Lacticaseibacillus absianus TaxID=2729623 RepID=UPI0015C9FB05|nr:DUF308 domain-containing protein [Lacticaseibacillus absianus]
MSNFESTRRTFRWPSFILGLLMLVLGIDALMHPGGALLQIVWFIALAMMISGIMNVALFFSARHESHTTQWLPLLNGLLDIVLAIYLWANAGAGIVILGYVVAFWLIMEAISALQVSWLSLHPGFHTFFAVLGLLAGIALLFTPLIGAIWLAYIVGVSVLVLGVLLISRAF